MCNLIFLQANKTGKSYKVPLSTFYVEEISTAVKPIEDVVLWCAYFEAEVKTCSNCHVIVFIRTTCPVCPH